MPRDAGPLSMDGKGRCQAVVLRSQIFAMSYPLKLQLPPLASSSLLRRETDEVSCGRSGNAEQ